MKIGILNGDDIGLEVVPECVKVMKAAGFELTDLVDAMVYITDLANFNGMNSAYRPAPIDAICGEAGDRAGACIAGAAVDSFQNDTADLPRAGAICALLSGEELARCWGSLGSIVGTTATDGADPSAPCAIAPDERSRDACAEAAVRLGGRHQASRSRP